MPKPHALRTIYAVGFLAALFTALPAYINSTFLSRFAGEGSVGVIFTAGSILAVGALVLAPHILERFGNYQTALALAVLNIATYAGIALSPWPFFVVALFLIHLAAIQLLWFSSDLFLERYSDDATTGGTRGIFLTIVNLAWVLSPALAGWLVGENNFARVYLVAAAAFAPALLLLVAYFRGYRDPAYTHIPFIRECVRIAKRKNIRKIFLSSFLLQSFYAVMVIYTPIYLVKHIGLDWETVGWIFTAMLLPFVLFEWPLGRLADSRLGEKELLAGGFVVMGLSTAALSFIPAAAGAWLWAALLFLTRTGASTVAIMNETYFFKKIGGGDSNDVSMFRVTNPAGWVVAPVVASVFLYWFDIGWLFLSLGIVMLAGIWYAWTLEDTR